MPTITIATCFILLITWANPGPVYAGEGQGLVWIDDEPKMLTLRGYSPELAWWTARLEPGDKAITDGYVTVMQNPSAVLIDNTPFSIVCNQVYLPVINR